MSAIEKSIVQIFSDKTIINYARPWSISHKERSTGSGFAIDLTGFKKPTKYILTNAHCVNEASYVTVRKQGISRTFRAVIEAIGYEVDLAILSVDNKEFWDDTPVLQLGGIPSKLSKVQVFGYPLGGYNVSITQGIVNRIQIIPYFNVAKGVTLQIDAPINFGNSGGPAMNEKGEVIGIAFAGEDDARTQNIGYLIPTLIIDLFLGNVKKFKAFNGLCWLGITKQKLTNHGLREYYKLKPHQTGILVTSVERLGSLYGKVKEGDIITKFNDIVIDSDGTISMRSLIEGAKKANVPTEKVTDIVEIPLASDERVTYGTAISLQLPGEEVSLTILRDGVQKIINFKTKLREFLVPILPYQIEPAYYIIGGLVFVPLTLMMIEKLIEQGEDPGLYGYVGSERIVEYQQKIVLSDILLTEITDGYKDRFQVIWSVNGQMILNLAHLREVIKRELKTSKFLRFEFENDAQPIVLKSADVKKYTHTIAQDQLGLSELYVNKSVWKSEKKEDLKLIEKRKPASNLRKKQDLI